MTGLQSIFVAIDNTTVRLWHIADISINSLMAPLRLPGIVGSSSFTALTGRAGKLRQIPPVFGPDG